MAFDTKKDNKKIIKDKQVGTDRFAYIVKKVGEGLTFGAAHRKWLEEKGVKNEN